VTQFVAPGATVGIIGGGVAAYELARAASHYGMKTVVLTPQAEDIALQAADYGIIGNASDVHAFTELRDRSTIITYINESVADGDMLAENLDSAQLPSGTDILAFTQDRYLEKVFLEDQNLNVLPYGQVITPDDIEKVLMTIGYPSVIKPIQKAAGADQQLLLRSDVDVWRAKGLLQKRPYILEAWLDQPRTLSVLCVKSSKGLQVLPLVETRQNHENFRGAVVPAQVDGSVLIEVLRIAEKLGNKIDYTGIFSIEFFLTSEGALYVKKVAPGMRLSGDILRAVGRSSQYALHMRAILGWPVPTLQINGSAVMLPLTADNVDAVNTQIQLKDKWRWQFFPQGNALRGELSVPGPLRDAFAALDATGAFDVDGLTYVQQLDNEGDNS
jgi:5-(carboxyamino)imidazole ribonucleotide synthase